MELSNSYAFSLSRRLIIGVALGASVFGTAARDMVDAGAADFSQPVVQIRHTGTQYIPVPLVDTNNAQVVIYRARDNGTSSVADVYVNGELQSALRTGEFSVFCVSPGRHAVESYLDDEPFYKGKTTLQSQIQLAGGETYFIETGSKPGTGTPTLVKRADAENRLLSYTLSPVVNRASSVKPCVYSGNMSELGNVLFAFAGSAAEDMEVGGQDVIGSMAAYLRNRHQIARVNIIGHADPVGNPASNHQLSLQRAETVKQLLVLNGVSDEILFPNGQGSSDPVIECKGQMSVMERNACNRVNRRVDVLIHANGQVGE